MARIAYADPTASELSGLVDRIVAERGELLHLYRMLLHSPPVAEGWLELMTAIRQKTTLPGPLREMIIIRIAHLNGAPYEAEQHRPIALREGVREEQLQSLAGNEISPEPFEERDLSALRLTDEMTRQVHVNEDCWSAIRALWTEREIIELVVTIASYNMVSRVLAALEIDAADE